MAQSTRHRPQPQHDRRLDHHVAGEPGQLGQLARGVAHAPAPAELLAPVVAPATRAAQVRKSEPKNSSRAWPASRPPTRRRRAPACVRPGCTRSPQRAMSSRAGRSGGRRPRRAGRSGRPPRRARPGRAGGRDERGRPPRRRQVLARTRGGPPRPRRRVPSICCGPRSLPAWGSMAVTLAPRRRPAPARSPSGRGSCRSPRSGPRRPARRPVHSSSRLVVGHPALDLLDRGRGSARGLTRPGLLRPRGGHDPAAAAEGQRQQRRGAQELEARQHQRDGVQVGADGQQQRHLGHRAGGQHPDEAEPAQRQQVLHRQVGHATAAPSPAQQRQRARRRRSGRDRRPADSSGSAATA